MRIGYLRMNNLISGVLCMIKWMCVCGCVCLCVCVCVCEFKYKPIMSDIPITVKVFHFIDRDLYLFPRSVEATLKASL
jgi:hypothetical protein